MKSLSIIISSASECSFYGDVFSGVPVFSAELVLSGIVVQRLDYERLAPKSYSTVFLKSLLIYVLLKPLSGSKKKPLHCFMFYVFCNISHSLDIKEFH